MTPEMTQPRDAEQMKLGDLWNVGIITFLLFCDEYPFNGQNHTQILKNIVSPERTLVFPKGKFISINCKRFIRKLLCNVDHRMTATEAMRHRWIFQETEEMKQFKKSKASLMKEKDKVLGVVDGLGHLGRSMATSTTQFATSSIISSMSLEQEINLEFVSKFDVDLVLNIFEDFRDEEIAEKEKQELMMEEDGESVLDVIAYDDLISCMTEQQKVCTLSEDYEHMPVTVMF